MYNIIPLILILISLSIIIIIIAKKFPVLVSLDVDNIQSEKEAKIKELIVSNRFKRNIVKVNKGTIKIFKIVNKKSNILFTWLRNKLYELRDSYKTETILQNSSVGGKIKELLEQAKEFFKNGNLEKAEKIFIEIIGIDNDNLEAFVFLGNIYFENKNFEEAIQTYKHILKLLKTKKLTEHELKIARAPEIYFNISIASKSIGKMYESLEYIGKAVQKEPNNPRYLDMMFELSIINKDKLSALTAYKKLEQVNPENSKLVDFKNKIDKL